MCDKNDNNEDLFSNVVGFRSMQLYYKKQKNKKNSSIGIPIGK